MKLLSLILATAFFNLSYATEALQLNCTDEGKKLEATYIEDHGELIVYETAGEEIFYGGSFSLRYADKSNAELIRSSEVKVEVYGKVKFSKSAKTELTILLPGNTKAINGTYTCQ